MEGDENSSPRSPLEGESSPRHPNSLNPVPPVLGREGLIDRTQFIRIIIQALYSLDYRKAAALLELESGVHLDSPEYTSLLFDTMAGRWDECVAIINSIDELEAEVRATACFLVRKEQFLELLGSGDGLLPAKDVLWKRIASLDMDRRKVHKLARSLISSEGILTEENMVSRRIKLLLDLVELLPPWVRVPSGRLEHLVETAVLKQTSSCFYHNSPDAVTLYVDHECSQEQIPSKCIQFSNNGEYLATSSRDCTAIIWMVKDDDTVLLKHILEGHMKPISFVAWSPDDTMLLTCGNEEALKLWDVETGMCKLTFTSLVNRTISSCAWFPNSDKIVCGSSEPYNCIFTCDLEGKELEVWQGERMPKVSDLAVTPDGCCLISICSSREIWIRDFPRGKERFIREDHSIASLSLSRDGQSLIVNLNSEEIHLWKVNATSDVPDKFRGHKQGKYVIRSCFGGSNCLFIASGSEDSQIYIWQRHHETPIKVLSGHSKTVNCVSWNPTKPHMLASASDDDTVRIWVANRNPTKIFT
ncbi:WD repeat-containing protein WDS homolog isoform X2 [Elaeis guineensis]|uniref:WD repeat-containing protein WDS homolog isoform X2 n=1 Tax=Elaeis guineensis var. tenera TaxID=51953 RepID=UPI003C6D5120